MTFSEWFDAWDQTKDPEVRRLCEIAWNAASIGPTGQFPDGKLDATDEGQLKMLITSDEQNVRLDFGKAIAWFALPKQQALVLAFNLLERCGVEITHKIQQNPTPGEH